MDKVCFSLEQIGKENLIIFLDNCVLASLVNIGELLSKEQTSQKLEEIVEQSYNYSLNLLDFVKNNSSVYITEGIYGEFGQSLPRIRYFGNFAFLPGANLSFKRKIARTQRLSLELYSTLKERILFKPKNKTKINENYLKIKKELSSISKLKPISETDISLYAFASFLNERKKTAIVTKDFDFIRLHDLFAQSNLSLYIGNNCGEEMYRHSYYKVH